MHINYLLKRFPKTEWSGPAWYKRNKDSWDLVHFIPIDLGSHSATEFKGKDLLKTMKNVQKTVDISGCFQGIIHSHHGMGAFHSGTDDTELEEGANKVGYPSLVVAHTGQSHAFKYSYEDQFGNIHLEKGKVVYNNKNQGSLWSGGFTRQMNGWGHYIDQEEVKYNEAYEKMQDAQKLYDAKKMSKKEFKRIEKEWEKFENDFHGVI